MDIKSMLPNQEAEMPEQNAAPRNPIVPDGPIPGENYTSDTRNYPWHRPPEITDMDKAIEASIKQLSTREGAFGLLNSLQAGITVVQATDMFVTSGIGSGKWTPDFAILLAGPVAKMIEIMAKDAGITFAMGLDDDPLPTAAYIKNKTSITNKQATKAGTALKEAGPQIKEPATSSTNGFMSKKTSEEII